MLTERKEINLDTNGMEIKWGDLVSICLPTYNSGKYLRLTLNSLASQTYSNIELIISDNASIDETKTIIEEFRPRFSNIKIQYNRENIGPISNINNLVQMATGKVIAVYHSDDIYEKGIIEECVRALIKHESVGIVGTMAAVIDENNDYIGRYLLPYSTYDDHHRIYGFDEVFKGLLECMNNHSFDFIPMFFVTPSIMVKKSKYSELGMWNHCYKSSVDYEMWLRICRKSDACIINKPFMNYRIHTDQDSQKAIRENIDIPDIVRVLREYCKYLENSSLKEKANLKINRMLFGAALNLNSSSQFKRSREVLREIEPNKLAIVQCGLYFLNWSNLSISKKWRDRMRKVFLFLNCLNGFRGNAPGESGIQKKVNGAIAKLKVALLTEYSQIGGGEKNIISLAKELAKEVEITVFCPKGDLFNVLVKSGIIVRRLNFRFKKRWIKFIPLIFYHCRFVSIIKEYDIIHAYSIGILPMLVFTKRPVIWTNHGFWEKAIGIRAMIINRMIQKVITVSKDVYKRAEFKEDKKVLIHLGIDILPAPKTVKSFNDNNVCILNIGRFQRIKGQDLLMRACIEIASKYPQKKLKVYFVGSTEIRDRQNIRYLRSLFMLKKTTSLRNLDFEFTGFKEDVLPYFELCDFTVVSARYESFSIVTVESLNAKKPVIAPNIGGPKEIIDSPHIGLLFKAENMLSLKDAIEKMIIDYSSFNTEMCYKRAQDFSIRNQAQKHLKLYKEIVLEKSKLNEVENIDR